MLLSDTNVSPSPFSLPKSNERMSAGEDKGKYFLKENPFFPFSWYLYEMDPYEGLLY